MQEVFVLQNQLERLPEDGLGLALQRCNVTHNCLESLPLFLSRSLQLEEMYLSHNCIMEDHVIEKFSKWAIH
jgi:hypothetical protein